jgi:hypothetical protein
MFISAYNLSRTYDRLEMVLSVDIREGIRIGEIGESPNNSKQRRYNWNEKDEKQVGREDMNVVHDECVSFRVGNE